jgi:hypothetical protein
MTERDERGRLVKGHKGYKSKPWLGKHLSEQTRRKMSEVHKRSPMVQAQIRKLNEEQRCEKHPFYGKHHTEESKAKMSASLKGRKPPRTGFKRGHVPWNKGKKGVMPPVWNKGLTREKDPRVVKYAEGVRETLRRKFKTGELKVPWKGLPFSEDHRRKLSLAKLGRKEPVEVKNRRIKRVLKGLMKKPTKLELRVGEILERRFPGEWKYVGDGKLVVGGKCPDYVHRDGRKVLEVFGGQWHDPDVSFKDKIPFHQTEEGVIKHYASYGYNCCVIWDYEVGDEALILKKLNSVGV